MSFCPILLIFGPVNLCTCVCGPTYAFCTSFCTKHVRKATHVRTNPKNILQLLPCCSLTFFISAASIMTGTGIIPSVHLSAFPASPTTPIGANSWRCHLYRFCTALVGSVVDNMLELASDGLFVPEHADPTLFWGLQFVGLYSKTWTQLHC